MNLVQRYLSWLSHRKLKNQLTAAILLMIVPQLVMAGALYMNSISMDTLIRTIGAYSLLFCLFYTITIYLFTRTFVISPLEMQKGGRK